MAPNNSQQKKKRKRGRDNEETRASKWGQRGVGGSYGKAEHVVNSKEG